MPQPRKPQKNTSLRDTDELPAAKPAGKATTEVNKRLAKKERDNYSTEGPLLQTKKLTSKERKSLENKVAGARQKAADSFGTIVIPGQRAIADLEQRAALNSTADGKMKKRGKLTDSGLQSLVEWKARPKQKRDQYVSQLAASARAKFGHGSVFVAKEAQCLVVGIPTPSIAFEWMIGQDVFPLGQVMMIAGKWRTCKSALLYEFMRWVDLCSGVIVFNEAETKFNEQLMQSILGYADQERPFVMNRCNYVEDIQQYTTHYLKDIKRMLVGTAENPGPGLTIPVIMGTDSIAGKSCRESHETLKDVGEMGRGYPIEALVMSRFIKAVVHEFDNWPIAYVYTNHTKKSLKDEGETRYSGGDQWQFQCSYQIETSAWREKIDNNDFAGTGIRLKCVKNSFGETHRAIRTRMLWWDVLQGKDDRGAPIYKQKTVWDWDWATVTFLNEKLTEGKYKSRLLDIGLSLTVQSPTADVECKANCPNVGMAKGEYKSFTEVGELIRKDAELCHKIRNALGIKSRSLLAGDYLSQLELLKKELP